jgi:uncharacterized membrane protein
MFVLVIIGYSFLAIYEFIPLYKQKFWNDFWVNAILAIFSLTFAMLLSFSVDIPSPEKPIREFITSIFGK